MKQNWIQGEWVEGVDTLQNINPSNIHDVIDTHALASQEQAETAIQAAKKAQTEWAHSTPQQRFDILDFIGSEILARKAELGRLLAREEGKTLAEGIGETARAGQVFKYFAGEALRVKGEHLDSVRPGLSVDITREPVGVVGIITPWNFPIAIPAWKIAPALAFGNSVVFKPAGLTPGCAWSLSEIISRSGLPVGVFNLVTGKGSTVGSTIVNHRDINAISFTGSVETGRGIAASCAQSMKKFQLEMGGKNPLVILDDADLDNAVNVACNGAYFSTGQRCTASSRLIVTEGLYTPFIKAMVEKIKSFKVGDALDPETQIGPVVDQTQLDSNLNYIKIGQEEGAKLAIGGELLSLENNGFYQKPALFTETNNKMRINQEEIFGPVASVIRVKDYEEALHIANDTPFGLSAGICTTSLKYSSHFKRHSQAGMVMVNVPTAGVDYHVPFGGTKGSSYGNREQGSYAAEFYTTVKTSYTAP